MNAATRFGSALALLLCLSTALRLSAQQQSWQIQVVDTVQQPVAAAFVAILTAEGDSVLAAALANEQGLASLPWPGLMGNSLLLRVELLGYKRFERRLQNAAASDTFSLRVVLHPQTFELATPVVNARRLAAAVSNNDTSLVDIETQRDSTERSIMELLRKSPQLDVTANGSLTYRGQVVNRVFFDGQDLFGPGGYREALSRLDAGLVTGVAAIERYHEDPVLARLEESQETILDISTDPSRRGVFDGQIEWALGRSSEGKWRHDESLTGLQLGRQVSYHLGLSASNIATRAFAGSTLVQTHNQSRAEPIGEARSGGLEPSYATFGLNVQDAPVSLVGDAQVGEGELAIYARSASGSTTRLHLDVGLANDDWSSQNQLRSPITDRGFLLQRREDFDLSTRSARARFEHRGAAPSGKTSWLAVVTAGVESTASEASIRATPLAVSPSVLAQADEALQIPLYLAARINRALGEAAAYQLYASYEVGTVDDQLLIDLDEQVALRVSDQAVAEPRRGFRQNLEGKHGLGILGTRLFMRMGTNVLSLSSEASRRHSRSARRWLPGIEEDTLAGARSRYNTLRLAATMRSSLSKRWRSEIGVEQLWSGVGDGLMQSLGGRLNLEHLQFGKPNLSLRIERSLRPPPTVDAPGLLLVRDPFRVEQTFISRQLLLREQATLRWRRKFERPRLDWVSQFDYTWRVRRLTGVYMLDSRSYTVDLVAPRTGEAWRAWTRMSHVNVAWGTVTRLTLAGQRASYTSNVVGLEADQHLTQVESELSVLLPQWRGLVSTCYVGLSSERVQQRAAFVLHRPSWGARLDYTIGGWSAGALYSHAGVWSESNYARRYRYVELELRHVFARVDEDRAARYASPSVALRLLNVAAERRVQEVQVSSPFVATRSLSVVPPSLLVELYWPLGSRN